MRLRRSLAVTTTLVAAATLALAGCGSSTPQAEPAGPTETAATGGTTDTFPITVTGALGETTIEAEPARVATWGWGSTEAAIALGVYPVAIAEQRWTVGEGNLLPWVEEAYDDAGLEHPTVLTDDGTGSTVPYEEFVAVEPDLILAPYSGLTQEQFDLLGEIAPVVAFEDGPWTTTWQDVITISAQALGRTTAGDDVLGGINDFLAEQRAAHPEFEGKTFAGVWDGDGVMSVYTRADARATVLEDLGLKIAPSVDELDSSGGGFYFDLSYEKLDSLTADLVVMYASSEDEINASLAKPELQAVPAIAAGQVVKVFDPVTVSSVSPPTALSFRWPGGLPSLIESIAATIES